MTQHLDSATEGAAFTEAQQWSDATPQAPGSPGNQAQLQTQGKLPAARLRPYSGSKPPQGSRAVMTGERAPIGASEIEDSSKAHRL